MTFLYSGYHSKTNLSAKEILEISQEINRNFTPCFSSQMAGLEKKTKLSSKELLEIADEIGRYFAPKELCIVPELTLLPIDPRHLYAHWDLGENSQTAKPSQQCNDQLTLRVYAQPDQEKTAPEEALWFDIALDSSKAYQQVTLPKPVDEKTYSAAIGKYCTDDGFTAFAHSNVIHAHHGRAAWHQNHENSTNCQAKNASGQGASN